MAYGVAHFGKSLIWYASELLFAFFLTEIAGFTAERMALIVVGGLLISALLDQFAGPLMQRWLATPRLAARLQLRGSLASAAALSCFFALAIVPEPYRLTLAILASIGFRVAFTFYDLPQNALMALMPRHERERLRLGATRIWFSGLATLTVALTVGPLIAGRDGSGAVYLLLLIGAPFCGVAVGGAAWLSAFASTAEMVAEQRQKTPIADPAGLFWRWMVIAVVTTLFMPAFAKLEPYFATYVINSAWWGGAVIIAMASGVAMGQPAWLFASRRTLPGKLLCASAVMQVLALAFFWAGTASNPAVLAAAAFAFGVGTGGVGMQLWAGVGQVVAASSDEETGRAYGSFGAIAKLGMAAGSLLIAVVVDQGKVLGAAEIWFPVGMTLLPGMGAVLTLLVGMSLIARDKRSC